MELIGVTGFRRSGKDSICKVLVSRFGFVQVAFADALREMAVAINPMISVVGAPLDIVVALHALRGTGEYPPVCTAFRYNDIVRIVSYERAKEIPDFRHFLQRLGTEGVRGTFGPSAWVDALERKLTLAGYERVCVSDVRFSSEAEWIKSRAGVIWRVARPGNGGDDTHASETEIPHLPADVELLNSGSLADLEANVVASLPHELLHVNTNPSSSYETRDSDPARSASATSSTTDSAPAAKGDHSTRSRSRLSDSPPSR